MYWIEVILLKFKVFFYWMLTWAVLHYFEYKIWNMKFNLWKFITSSFIFWLLAEFSNLLIDWNFVTIKWNESAKLVIIIILTSALYLFLPFILQKDNRNNFIISVLEKFWFNKIIKNKKWNTN